MIFLIVSVRKRCLYSDDLICTTAAQALLNMKCYKERDIMDAIKLFVAEKGRFKIQYLIRVFPHTNI